MEDHKKAHRKFTGIILDYERRLVESDFDIRIVKDLAGTLTAWLIYHVADADQRIAKGDTGAGLTLAQSFLNIFSDSALDVMEKMAGFSANDIEEQFVSNKRVQGDIFVEIGLIGDLKGRIIFGFSKELAFKLIEIMTFVEPAEIDELVCSALAELSNITCGNAATALTEHGKVCDIKTPVVTAEPPCGLIDGMVLQTNVLFSGTIKENMRWGNKQATDEEIIEACKIAQADEFIQEFKDGYDTKIERGGANVSGGQRQRLCIARALLMNPKILILDDSTSAVDTKTDSLIRHGFASSLKETTKIIIGQRISSIQDADRIIVMNDGRIDAIGTHDDLVANNAIYREVYKMQTQGKGVADAE